MASTVTGTVHLVEETKEYGKNNFRKRMVVLEQENGKYPNFIPVEFIQDSCELADGMSVGDEVEVTYRLKGRKWQPDGAAEAKYFLNAEAVGFKVVGGGGGSDATSQAGPEVDDSFDINSDEDVPF